MSFVHLHEQPFHWDNNHHYWNKRKSYPQVLSVGSSEFPKVFPKNSNHNVFNQFRNFRFDFQMNHHGLSLCEPGQEIYDEFHSMYPTRNPGEGIFLQLTELCEEPRVIKTHLPFSLLPNSLSDMCKVRFVLLFVPRSSGKSAAGCELL